MCVLVKESFNLSVDNRDQQTFWSREEIFWALQAT